MGIAVFQGLFDTFRDVTLAMFPLAAIFVFFQVFFIKWSAKKFIQIVKGLLLAYVGLILFLHGVHIGFMPVGELMGEGIGALSYRWVMIPIGFIFGFLACFAEPAVRVLIYEVEKNTGGYINKNIMLYFLSFGVAVSVALSVGRVFTGIQLMYILAPGYLLALFLTKKCSKTFVAIAFDSGGVATGPMVVTFVLSMIVGFSSSIEGSNPLLDGFGMISLVALTPILSILILGSIYASKGNNDDE